MAYKMLIFIYAFALVTGAKGRRPDRKFRFISFDTSKNDIDVSLDFNVPFLSIPIKKTMNSVLDGLPGLAIPKINLNPMALAFGSFIIVATSVLLPIFSKGLTYDTENYYRNYFFTLAYPLAVLCCARVFFLKKEGLEQTVARCFSENWRRVLDNGDGQTSMIIDFTNQLMSVSRGCPLKIACWMSQRRNELASTKTMEQIIRNKLVLSIFNTSTIEEAILNGRRGHNCATYEPCPLREEHLPTIMKNFGILTSRNVT